jgi:hypothetical protein
MYRQGDILIVQDAVPTGTRHAVDGAVVQFGELTGHAHRLEGGQVFDLVQESRWEGQVPEVSRHLEVGPEGAKLVHDEHHTIEIPEGTYRVIRQREFDPANDERWVSD